jgi:hypothetical protein
VDEACALAGLQVEAAAARGEKPVISKQSSVASKQSYRSAKNLVRKKVRIPKSGVW